MAETRKFDPTSGDNDVQRQVREALGETVRPVAPGADRKPSPGGAQGDDAPGITDLDSGASFLYYGPEGSQQTGK